MFLNQELCDIFPNRGYPFSDVLNSFILYSMIILKGQLMARNVRIFFSHKFVTRVVVADVMVVEFIALKC